MQNRFIPLLIAFFFLTLGGTLLAQEFGLASYYSDEFQGSKTAYGYIYDKNELTAAHKKYPPGTTLRVTNLDNKKSVTVTVIDRGPFIKGRIVDLSRRAAERIGIIQNGMAEVKVEVVKLGTTRQETAEEEKKPEKTTPPARVIPDAAEETQSRIAEPKPEPPAETKQPEPRRETTAPTPQPTPRPTPRSRLVGKEFQDYGLYQIQILTTPQSGFGVQVASLVNYPNVFRQVADLQARGFNNVLINIEKGPIIDEPIYKIVLGSFDTEAAAQRYRSDLKSRYKINGFVVNLAEMAAGKQ